MKHSRLSPLGHVLADICNTLGLRDRIALEQLRRSWQSLFGEALAGHTSPSELSKGTLVVAVDSPAWLQQLRFMQKELLAKLAPHGIREIKLKHGATWRKDQRTKKEPPPPFMDVPLSEADRRAIAAAVTAIEDETVREAARQAMQQSLSKKRNK